MSPTGETKNSWLKDVIKPLRPLRREIMLSSLFVNLFAFATPVFVLQTYDRVIAQGGISTLQGLAIGMVVIVLFDFVVRMARSGLFRHAAMVLDARVSGDLFDKLLSLPLRTLETRPAAFWQSCFRDADQLRAMLSGTGAVLAAEAPFALLGCILVYYIASPVAWVLAVLVPLYLLVAWRASSANKSGTVAERRNAVRRDSLVAELITGRATAKALGVRSIMRDLWEKRQTGTIESSLKRAQSIDRYHSLGHALNVLATVTMVSVGALAVLEQNMTMGSLIAANMLMGRIIQPLHQLIHQWHSYTGFKQAMERLNQVFHLQDSLQDSVLDLERPKGRVETDGIIFRYSGDDQANVIQGMQFGFGPGGMHAIVGPNGCGKSTLLKLLRGLYGPLAGRVMLDGADIDQFSEQELASWIGYLPQECRLFTGNIKQNLLMGYPSATDKEIVAATKRVGVHDQIMDLPKGYGSQVGEAGDMLSGGLRQKLTIARALIGDRPVLILDEPTSNLDSRTERNLAGVLKNVSETSTVIMVTHSPVMLEACDNILVLDRGRVAAGGPTKEILPRLNDILSQQSSSGAGK